jgi:hypothetical protein
MRAPNALSPRPGLGSRCPRSRRHIQKGGFDPFHEDLRLTRPRHPNYSLLLWHILLWGCVQRDHRHLCLLRFSLTHSAEESLAYTLIHSGRVVRRGRGRSVAANEWWHLSSLLIRVRGRPISREVFPLFPVVESLPRRFAPGVTRGADRGEQAPGRLQAALAGTYRRFTTCCYCRGCPAATPDRLHNNLGQRSSGSSWRASSSTRPLMCRILVAWRAV